MYNEIAKKILNEELERIKQKPNYYCNLYEWNKINESIHTIIPKLTVRDVSINQLADLIKKDHLENNKWKDIDDPSMCAYDDLMIAEYIEDILKDFTFQLKSYSIGIPLFNF